MPQQLELANQKLKYLNNIKQINMELPAFDPVDFKKFTDGKTIVKVSHCNENHSRRRN